MHVLQIYSVFSVWGMYKVYITECKSLVYHGFNVHITQFVYAVCYKYVKFM